jgi:hypothetical protein
VGCTESLLEVNREEGSALSIMSDYEPKNKSKLQKKQLS